MIIVRLLSPSLPGWFGTTKSTRGLGAGIVMESISLTSPIPPVVGEMASRVENRPSGVSLPVAADEAFASSPQSGWAWLCFLFPLIEPNRQISRIRLSGKTHDGLWDAACNF